MTTANTSAGYQNGGYNKNDVIIIAMILVFFLLMAILFK